MHFFGKEIIRLAVLTYALVLIFSTRVKDVNGIRCYQQTCGHGCAAILGGYCTFGNYCTTLTGTMYNTKSIVKACAYECQNNRELIMNNDQRFTLKCCKSDLCNTSANSYSLNKFWFSIAVIGTVTFLLSRYDA
ncbi:uncharacterized protein LOC141909058 [Tubulanus polymorphus]|uniref:uncharacterized protein LOC141909058 n=1 Tax=Tubulanus polymorphus TaxID=672921 RepID=UPI003DA683BB